MDDDDDMFVVKTDHKSSSSLPSQLPASSAGHLVNTLHNDNPESKSLFQILNVSSKQSGNLQDEETMRRNAAVSRMKKEQTTLMNLDAGRRRDEWKKLHSSPKSHKSSQQNTGGTNGMGFDEDEEDEEIDEMINMEKIGEDEEEDLDQAGLQGRTAMEAMAKEEDDAAIREGRLISLDMKKELERGEVDAYGQMLTSSRKKRRRGEDGEGEDPSQLAMPSKDGKFHKKHKIKTRKVLETGEEESISDDEGEEENYNDLEEDEELNKEDSWLDQISKAGDSMISSSSKRSSSMDSQTTPQWTPLEALQLLKSILLEFQHHEKFTKVPLSALPLIKILSPPDDPRPSKVRKTKDEETPHDQHQQPNQEEKQRNQERFDNLVAVCDFLLSNGFPSVYQDTLEEIDSHIAILQAKSLKQRKTGRQTKSNPMESTSTHVPQAQVSTFWQYKWDASSNEVFGPYDVPSMQAWTDNFANFPSLLVRGFKSPALAGIASPDEGWQPFQPNLWR